MGKFGYDFYFKIGEEVLTLPITPSSLKMKIGSNNKVVTLINEGDINILKSPSLVEFEFDARFPMRSYPYSREALNFETYLNKFTALKTDKQPFIFNVIRTTPNGKGTWATVRRVTLEDLEIEENADEGDDVIVSFTLKEYKEYGVVTHKQSTDTDTTSTSEKPRSTDDKATKSKNYTIRQGDTLWAIAKDAYGNGAKWTIIYEANKTAIEEDAIKHGRKSSSNGHWIYPNLQIVIPAINGNTNNNLGSASKKSDSKPTDGKDKSTDTAKHYTLTINCNGIYAYTGTMDILYTFNGVEQRYTTTKQFGQLILQVDAGSRVEVGATPKDGNPQNSVVFQSPTGNWTSHGTFHKKNGIFKIESSYLSHYRICTNVTTDLGVTVKWIRNVANFSVGV